MKNGKRFNSFEIALSGISCAVAVAFLALGILSGWLTATGYFVGILSMMVPLTKQFFKGGFGSVYNVFRVASAYKRVASTF